jgi:phytoene dehydrogenase-like protein
MSWIMHRHGVDANANFRAFVDEQMLISTQSTSAVAPYLTGAMGLAYPSETYYPVGGMYAPALQLLRHITQHGGQVRFRRVVTSIVRRPASSERGTTDVGRWTIECANGERYEAENVISSIPIWNMQHITDGDVANYYGRLSSRFSESWAALTMYFVVPQPTELPAPYIQLHVDKPIEGVHSKSLFLSVSHKDDEKKAPKGEATVTVSTHTKGTGNWERGTGNGYKQRVMREMVEVIKRRLPELGIEAAHHIEGGTPETWERYTLRYHGYVGGIPHSTKKPMLMMPKNVTPFKGLYQIGDSAFPGQGTPAVIMGAWNTVARMFAS